MCLLVVHCCGELKSKARQSMGDEKDVLRSHPCGAENGRCALRERLHRSWVGMGMHIWAALGSSHSQWLWAGKTCVRLLALPGSGLLHGSWKVCSECMQAHANWYCSY